MEKYLMKSDEVSFDKIFNQKLGEFTLREEQKNCEFSEWISFSVWIILLKSFSWMFPLRHGTFCLEIHMFIYFVSLYRLPDVQRLLWKCVKRTHSSVPVLRRSKFSKLFSFLESCLELKGAFGVFGNSTEFHSRLVSKRQPPERGRLIDIFPYSVGFS